ncbi:reactive mitochondrial oxygen species modulator 1-domain-containing protein [Radiomyces spectabilis]|uniref:reactive mitochondrial oxygen species modulator 1-domain-containing protein n=1 Tax=Radiomyces spectabilis TaxID=64574 RepID=UPI00221F7D17|nr:reactive mitochondrial oxygen species modulator 1-domain-containing protein [Radiomyces spectabilis]KAI8391670.1 reactive mitochondrial oxygen species modulator 1-domain-containing protein [Radiomyces spectabilis]
MEPSAFDKMKMGALMGGTVGLCVGFVFGSVTLLRYGSGPKGPFSMLSQYMLGSAASFGFFMSIGSVIRSEGRYLPAGARPISWNQPMPIHINQRKPTIHNS